MTKQSVDYAVVAQMVCDAIRNDARKDEDGNLITSSRTNILERAKAWYGRLKELQKKRECYCGISEKVSFEEFLCDTRPPLRILDFWEGDIVECLPNHRVGVIRKTIVGMDSGYASVLFADGSRKDVDEGYMLHSSIPGEILDIAMAQLIASKKCPFMNKEGSENDLHKEI